MNTAASAGGMDDAPTSAAAPAAILPAELERLAERTVAGARLWPRERSAVGRELRGHFLDGLAAGADPATLARQFGDPAQAARLIRRAAHRRRPRWYHATRAAGWAIVGLVGVYAVLGARYWLAEPTLRRNILLELRREAEAVPAEDRGWPLYVEAIKALGPPPADAAGTPIDIDPAPGSAGRTAWVAHLSTHPDAVRLLDQAVRRPVVGAPLRTEMDPEYAKAIQVRQPSMTLAPATNERENPLLIGILLPHLGEMRQAGRIFNLLALEARDRRDQAGFLLNLERLIRVAEQAASDRFLISQVVAIALGELALSTAREGLAAPGFLDDAGLARMAHVVGGPGRMRLDFSAERLSMIDMLQRTFTDDGSGDGRRLPANTAEMKRVLRDFGVRPAEKDPGILAAASAPLRSAVGPSRRDFLEAAEAMISAMERDEALPFWRRAERSGDAAYAKFVAIGWPELIPALENVSMYGDATPFAHPILARDVFEQRRDAVLAELAVRLHRLESGRWPESLAELTPRFLPSRPLDFLTGEPLRYRLTSRGPILYSVGPDLDDDGGRAASAQWAVPPLEAAYLRQALIAPQPSDGDIVFWAEGEPSPTGG